MQSQVIFRNDPRPPITPRRNDPRPPITPRRMDPRPPITPTGDLTPPDFS